MATATPRPNTSRSVPTAVRLPRNYKPVEKKALIRTDYPCGSSSVIPEIHDLQYYQGVLANPENFVATTEVEKCDVFEVQDGVGNFRREMGSDEINQYLGECGSSQNNTSIRVLFCTLKSHPGTSFGSQLSLKRSSAEAILKQFRVSPQFLPLLLGEPDYWAPGDFATYDGTGQLKNIEFFCQHPRWNIHRRYIPWSVYLNYTSMPCVATYIVVSDALYSSNETLKARLVETFGGSGRFSAQNCSTADPFLVHIMAAHESFRESKDVVTDLRMQLYDQLDLVDVYARAPSDRGNLESLTNELHIISQNADSLLASAEMAIMIAERMDGAHARFTADHGTVATAEDRMSKCADSIRYLLLSIQAEKRWLLSYKSRKDIGMNLVFNLVTQQDSATNLVIARETKHDSTSMKTIAALTMVFLPGTFVCGFFGMNLFPFDQERGSLDVSDRWLVYARVAVPLTLLTVLVWWMWGRWSGVVRAVNVFGGRVRDMDKAAVMV